MNTEVKKEVVKRPYDATNNQMCGFRNVYEVKPGYGWNTKKWGPAPLLGYVRADSEYWALYAAYNKGIAQPNVTFEYDISKAKKFVANL
jgi:hypothetical protein